MMDQQTYHYLKRRPELLQFVRIHPEWYRLLARNPMLIDQLEKEANQFYGKTLSHQLERMNHHLQMATMFMQLAKHMKD